MSSSASIKVRSNLLSSSAKYSTLKPQKQQQQRDNFNTDNKTHLKKPSIQQQQQQQQPITTRNENNNVNTTKQINKNIPQSTTTTTSTSLKSKPPKSNQNNLLQEQYKNKRQDSTSSSSSSSASSPSTLNPLSLQQQQQQYKNQQPTPTHQKGLPRCFTCNQSIDGPIVSAMSKTFHPKCFNCHSCKTQLGTDKFYEKKTSETSIEASPFCEYCFQTLFLPKCAYCDQSICGNCLTALGTTWCSNHFFCFQCGCLFDQGSGFLEKENHAYCERDYFSLFGIKCASCAEGIVGEYVSAVGKEYHHHCFNCTDCKQEFANGQFFEFEGNVYCEHDYHKRKGSLCSFCNEPVLGKAYVTDGVRYHVECFRCERCGVKGSDVDTMREYRGKVLCLPCEHLESQT